MKPRLSYMEFKALIGSIFLLSMALGIFLILKPEEAIKIQIRFYASINWKMEPLSLTKEKRNTRWMGMFLIGVTLGTLFYLLVNP